MAGSRPKSGPTMHDVAAAAGVSQATVSLVLNSASGSRFSEDTRKRVRDAVNRLGYRTNAHAKVLREGVAGMIGFIGDSVATSPFAGKIIEGAQQRAWEAGLLLLTVNTGGDKELEPPPWTPCCPTRWLALFTPPCITGCWTSPKLWRGAVGGAELRGPRRPLSERGSR